MKLSFKFNSGNGALLCDCYHILATGYDHHQKTYCCPNPECCKKWYITKHYYKNDVYGSEWDGKLVG